jgi:hypothetical protein
MLAANTSACSMRGRNLFVGITSANTEREAAGLTSVWPKDDSQKSDDQDDIAGITPGTSEEYFEELFSTAVAKAEKHGVSLYCGEYGMIDLASAEDSLKWFRTIHTVFEKHGISRSVWNYKEMDFGLTDKKYDGMRDELLKYL